MIFTSFATYGAAFQTIVGIALVCAMLLVELPKRFNDSDIHGQVQQIPIARTFGKRAVRILCRSLPEVGTLTIFLVGAIILRAMPDTSQCNHPEEQADWERIKIEWPILRGADTLLGLQAILRLMVVMCAAAKARLGKLTPFSGMVGVFTLAAMSLRGVIATQGARYELDGPLGGRLAMGVEATMVPLLGGLASKVFKELPLQTVVVIIMAWSVASSHYFNFAGDPNIDRLFTTAHVMEAIAAAWFFAQSASSACHSSKGECNVASGFAHLMMPAQQALSTYYFFNVMELHDSSLIGAGHPLCLIKLLALFQLMAYFVAAAFHLAERLDKSGLDSTETLLEVDGGVDVEACDVTGVRDVWRRTSDCLTEHQSSLLTTVMPRQVFDL